MQEVVLLCRLCQYSGLHYPNQKLCPSCGRKSLRRDLRLGNQPMGLLPDWAIEKLAREQQMISPFVPEKISGGRLSFGLSAFGYDMTLAREFKVLKTPQESGAWKLDPKQVDERQWEDVETDVLELAPGGCVLGRSIEVWRMPDDVFALVIGKSSMARSFQLPLMCPMEPSWHGTLTLELVNLTPYTVKYYAGEGIAQAVFFRGVKPKRSYTSAGGKYNGQVGVTHGFVH